MMTLAEVLFLTIAIYLGYRFIFNFLLPIIRATSQVRRQFRNMQGSGSTDFGGRGFGGSDTGGTPHSQPASGPHPGSGSSKGSYKPGSHKPPAEDYIDFEEVK